MPVGSGEGAGVPKPAVAAEGAGHKAAPKKEGLSPVASEQKPKPEQERHKHPYYKDTRNGVAPEDFLKKYPEQEQLADDLTTKAKEALPREEHESEVDYQTRMYNELEKRLRFTGDFRGTSDELFAIVENHPDMTQQHYTLMAVEAKRAVHLKTENKRLEEDARSRLGRLFRRDVKTEVTHIGDPSYVEGDYEHYFDEQQKPKELPKTDLYAFTLVADRLLDVVDPATQAQGEGKSYREQMKALEDALGDKNATQAQRDQAGRQLISLRSQFYSMTIEAVRTVDQPQYVNPDAETQSPKDRVLVQMYDKLKLVRSSSIDDLVDQYEGVGTGMSDKRKAEIKQLLSGRKSQLLDFALKGADLMQRRISYNPKLHDVPDTIRYKKFVQGGDDEDEGLDIKIPTPPPGGNRRPEDLQPGPTGNGEGGEPPVTPVEDESVVEPETPEGAPVDEDGGEPQPPEPPPTEEPLTLDLTLGAGALHDREPQEIVEIARHGFAHDTAQIPVPASRLGRFGMYLRHPLKFGWENTLRRNVTEKQWIRWAADMERIAKGTVNEQTVPVELTENLVSQALDQGRAMRDGQSWWRKRVWGMSDITKRVFGVSQTSEQIFAKRWLEGQVAQPPAARDQTLQAVTARTLQEQTSLGERFAEKRSGMTTNQANRLVLARDAGETRHEVPEEMREEVNARLKAIVERYANPNAQNRLQTDEALVAEVNQYMLGDFLTNLPANMQGEFSAPEVATNILSLAQQVRDNWDRYQTTTVPVNGQEGQTQTAWEATKINVLYGQAEWGGVRGKQEMGRINEWLARRLAERPPLRGSGTISTAISMVSDLGTFGGSYAAGWVSSGALFGTNNLVRSLGGVAGVAGIAGLRETGLDFADRGGIFGRKFIIKGNYQREVEQLSREQARGRENPPTARIRPEMQAVLVDRIQAGNTITQLEQQINQQQLTTQQARELLVRLARLDAQMRLTDLSGQETVNFKVQNYIQFTEGNENQEYRQLKKVLLDGMGKLQQHANGDPQFLPQGQQLFSEQFNADGVFDRYSALAEAQLRVGSQDAQVRQWLQREGGFSQPQTDAIVQQLLPNMNMQINRENASLQGKERILRGLRNRRFVATAAGTFVGGAVATGLFEGGKIVGAEGLEMATEGWDRYWDDWKKVLRGEMPVVMQNGQPVADVTPLQRGVLWAEQAANWVPAVIGGVQQVDGVEMNFGAGVRYDQASDAIVDTRTGNVISLKEFTFKTENGNLVIESANPALTNQQAADLFKQRVIDEAGITLHADGQKTVDILTKAGTHPDPLLPKTKVPDGTHWVKDGNTYDLVTDKGNKVLIDNASFDASGKMQAVSIHKDLTLSAEGGKLVGGAEAVAEWEKLGNKIDRREWYSYNQPGSQENELRMYDRRDGNAVVLDMAKMTESHQMGLHPESVDVRDVVKAKQAVIAFSIPGHTGEPILVKVPESGELRLDPADTDPNHKINFYNGKSMQAGEFAKMVVNQQELAKLPQGDIATEVYGRQNVFNLGLDGKRGFIEAGTVAQQDGKLVFQSFATIQGSGDLTGLKGDGTNLIELTKTISETTPKFRVEAGPLPGLPDMMADITVLPFPVRQNIERSGRADLRIGDTLRETGWVDRDAQPRQPDAAPVSEEERQRRQDERQQVELQAQRAHLAGEQRRLEQRRQNGQADAEDEQRLQEIAREMERLNAELRVIPQELQELGPQRLQARFEGVQGAVDRNHRFYVENPTDRIDLTDEQLQQLASPLPFFVITNNSVNTNRVVVPWAWELGPEGANNTRFVNGELSTEGDSGLLGVSAASGENPEAQGRLYKSLADVVLRTHQANPTLLHDWLEVQGRLEPGSPATSLDMFKMHDALRVEQGAEQEETLLGYDAQVNVSLPAIEHMWEDRLRALRTALDNDQLTYAQLRQLEFLSHSVNVPEVITTMQQGQVQGTTPQPVARPIQPLTGAVAAASRAEAIRRIVAGEDQDTVLSTFPQDQRQGILDRVVHERATAGTQTTGETPGVELSPGGKHFLRNNDNRLKKLAQNKEIELHEGQTAGKYWWQQVTFGSLPQKDSDHLFRGYLMVDPHDMIFAVHGLELLAEERKKQGKTTDFKWLKMTFPPDLPADQRASYGSNANNIGNYPNLNPTDPRIVIYADNPSDIQEILQALSANPTFLNVVEQNRIKKYGGKPENAPRRPGTNAFVDTNGREWRSLNFNDKPGYSEDEAADPDWRDRKIGSRTEFAQHP